MEASPLVSVIVPTYNRTGYLQLTLESIHSQSYQNIEIIVVDDGSPGEDNAILCEQFSKVTYLKIENSGGPARPRNIGVGVANGDLIAFTDDDDVWLLDKLEKQIMILTAHQEYGLIHGPCEVIDEFGDKTGEIIGRPGSPDVKHGDVKLRMMGNWTLMMPTPLLRREILEQVGFFSEEIPPALEDVEFWIRCSFYTKFYYLDESLVFYRKHANNISSDRKKYVPLPLYLADVIEKQQEEGRINLDEAKLLRTKISRMQLKMINISPRIVLSNMSRINAIWFLDFVNIKLLVKKLMGPK